MVVSDVAISAMLMKEDEGKQKLVFYKSKTPLDAETKYSTMEKMVITLVGEEKAEALL